MEDDVRRKNVLLMLANVKQLHKMQRCLQDQMRDYTSLSTMRKDLQLITKVIVDCGCHCINKITTEGFDHQITMCQTLTTYKCSLWICGGLCEL